MMNTNSVTIEIPTHIYDHVLQMAEQEHRTLEEFLVERVIQSFTGDDPALSAMDAQMACEVAAFEKLHTELVRNHLHQYVAITGGDVVDVDRDEMALFFRIERDYPESVVLIRQVQRDLPNRFRSRRHTPA